jgi:tetratricopeptide (TPR) repeat protein
MAAPYPEEIIVPPTFSRADYAVLLTALAAPGPKLLDLSSARVIRPDFFTALSSTLAPPAGTVPRLAIVLAFEHWACLRQAAAIQLEPLRERGVDAELFYEEQAYDARLLFWFSHGMVVHNVGEVLNTLGEWQEGPISPVVLDAVASLVYQSLRDGGPAAHIVELARIALASGAYIKALSFAREALLHLGEVVSTERLEALRILGLGLMGEGKLIAATGILDSAVAMAVALGAMEYAADLLRQIGCGEFDRGDALNAERRFRAAIELLPQARSELLASLHHNLSVALLSRGRDGAEAHAVIALASRPDKKSEGAQMDVDLLRSIRREGGLAS